MIVKIVFCQGSFLHPLFVLEMMISIKTRYSDGARVIKRVMIRGSWKSRSQCGNLCWSFLIRISIYDPRVFNFFGRFSFEKINIHSFHYSCHLLIYWFATLSIILWGCYILFFSFMISWLLETASSSFNINSHLVDPFYFHLYPWLHFTLNLSLCFEMMFLFFYNLLRCCSSLFWFRCSLSRIIMHASFEAFFSLLFIGLWLKVWLESTILIEAVAIILIKRTWMTVMLISSIHYGNIIIGNNWILMLFLFHSMR